MTGPQHYAKAEELLAELPDDYDAAEEPKGSIQSALTIQRAQVHATLALAAATARPAVVEWIGDELKDGSNWTRVLT